MVAHGAARGVVVDVEHACYSPVVGPDFGGGYVEPEVGEDCGDFGQETRTVSAY